jgi:hypothetical protein
VPSTGNGAYNLCVPASLYLRNDVFPCLSRYDIRSCVARIPHRISADNRGHGDRRPLLKWD